MFDSIIHKLFSTYWIGPQRDNLELAKKQLYKNLTDQINGYWSGHTAYYIMTAGGFLINSKSGTNKKLTMVGEMFMKEMEDSNKF